MPIRQRIMTLNGNAGVGTVNAITKNLRKGNKLIKLKKRWNMRLYQGNAKELVGKKID